MSKISIGIVAAALSLATPFLAHAAGLGRLTVFSPLGQPLNAEIEIVSLQPGEEDSLTVRPAPIEAFRNAGIEPSPALLGMRFTIVRRDGRPVIRVTSPNPVNEPFLDLLVELQWNNGRLVREYAVLLDPPEYKAPQAIAAAPSRPPAPEAKPLPPVAVKPDPKPAPAPAPAAAPHQDPAPAVVTEARVPPGAEAQHEVKPGETLGGIARAHLTPGVSLNQMLMALYRANQDAFLRDNINLVRAGRILNVPPMDDIAALDAEEANRLVQAHRGQFDEYRTRLAAAPARADSVPGQQAVAGTIQPQAAPAPTASQDQLRLAQADPAKAGSTQLAAAQGDDAVARERALKEAQSRVADLEKNVADLQKLLQLKNEQLAALERQAAGKFAQAPATPVAPAAQAPAAPAEQAPAAPAAQAAATPAQQAPATQSAQPAAPAAPAAPATKQAEPTKAKAAPPPPPPPPSLMDEILENPIALGGLALIVVLLVGALVLRRRRAAPKTFQEGLAPGAAAATAATAAKEGPDAAPAAAASPAAASATGEEVDPIAEADVYMAYGRDAQAEEILKEALQKDPDRPALHAKLLEIHAKRRDTRAFEQTATKLQRLTNGSGPEWEKAAALGRSLDSGNALYGGAAGAAAAAAAPVLATSAPTLDFDLGGATSPSTPSVDLDLGAATTPPREPEKEKSDFTPEGTLIMDTTTAEATVTNIDFDLNLGTEEPAKPAAAKAEPVPAKPETGAGLDFDLNLDLGMDAPPAPTRAAAPLDLSTIDLDLGSAGEPSAAGGGVGASDDPKWQEVATKLDLAKAYEEMGDKDGARELLAEVMKDGDATQKGQAELLLTKL
ncbi:MAG TPA: FimV/HubP family polar landmark protein [Burkholderiales bacterium]|nr:FimV/HubP family polar landmark protein [Burkholderiales bacterium]